MKKWIALFVVVTMVLAGPGMLLGAPGRPDAPGNPEFLEEVWLESLEALKEAARNQYSGEEIAELARQMAEIRQQYRGVVPLDVDAIVSESAQFKFDTPPVIKDGRTLVPVRALTAAFGASVDWDSDARTVTVEKDDVTMVIYLEDGVATVNNVVVDLDVPPMIMNGRMVLPLRFILEAMGFDVNYRDGVIEIVGTATDDDDTETDDDDDDDDEEDEDDE